MIHLYSQWIWKDRGQIWDYMAKYDVLVSAEKGRCQHGKNDRHLSFKDILNLKIFKKLKREVIKSMEIFRFLY